jgi:Lamin Tail Domain
VQETFYQVGAHAVPSGALAVTELHYNPAGDDDAEFIELANVSNAAINLRGVKFASGVVFTFPTNRDVPLGPGRRVILADSQFTLQKVHGWEEPVGGIYAGAFDNAGERVTIVAADGVTVLVDFTYDGAAPWPDAADGDGRSLVLINPAPGIDHSNAANWRLSTEDHGNPNSSDTVPFAGNPALDLDGDGLDAFLEFGLGTSDTAAGILPLDVGRDGNGVFITLDHANANDAASLRIEASQDLSLWNVPVVLERRSLLPDGRLRSTWRASLTPPALFFRARTP